MMVDNTSNLMLNASVVAALILSMSFPLPLSGLQASETSEAVLGPTGAAAAMWAFMVRV